MIIIIGEVLDVEVEVLSEKGKLPAGWEQVEAIHCLGGNCGSHRVPETPLRCHQSRDIMRCLVIDNSPHIQTTTWMKERTDLLQEGWQGSGDGGVRHRRHRHRHDGGCLGLRRGVRVQTRLNILSLRIAHIDWIVNQPGSARWKQWEVSLEQETLNANSKIRKTLTNTKTGV